MRPWRPALKEFFARDETGEGETRRDPLGHHQDVWLHVLVLHGEHLPSATESGLHFVCNQQDPEFAREFAQAGEEARGWNDVAPFAKHRLHDDGGDIFCVDQRVQREFPLLFPAAAATGACSAAPWRTRVTRGNWCAIAVWECGRIDRAGEWLKVSAVDVLRRGHRHRLRRAAVISAAEDKDHASLSCAARQLDRRLHRFAP